MSTALQAHNACLELFRRSEPQIWCNSASLIPRVSNNFVKHPRNNYVRHPPACCSQTRQKKPYLRVENKNEDFLYLANHLIETAKKPQSSTKHKEYNCVTQPKSDSKQVTNQAPGKSGWVVLDNLTDNEWDYVHIERDSQPSYADIVMSNIVYIQDPKKQEMTRSTHECLKQSLVTAEQEYCMSSDDNLASLEDMWFNSKYEGAKSYHRKIDIKRKMRVIVL